MIVVMLYVFIRKRVIEISTEFFVIKLNSKMCAFSALYEGIGSKQTVQYLHRKKNQDFDQCVRCKYCTVAGGGDMQFVQQYLQPGVIYEKCSRFSLRSYASVRPFKLLNKYSVKLIF